LQTITGSLEKLESCFAECETVQNREELLVEENLPLPEKVDELQNKQRELQRRHEQHLASFADTNQALIREHDRRCVDNLREYKAVQDEDQRRLKSQEQEWKQQVAAEEIVAQHEKENGSKAQ
jgi:hypothetical protein